MMSKEESTNVVNFMTPGTGVSCATAWLCGHIHFKSYSEKMFNFIKQAREQEGGARLKLCISLMTCINIQHMDCYCIKGHS